MSTAPPQGGGSGPTVAGSGGGRAPHYPDALRHQVEAYLGGLRFAREPAGAGLDEAMRYSLMAGGKRIRPVLALATARALGRRSEWALPFAAALELIHTYSLIHDDLPAMDDDELRRGRPTCHVRYGEDIAILAGDALYAEAFRLICSDQEGAPADILAAVLGLADATGANGMVGGQYMDVRAAVPDTDDGLRRLHELKTGRLISAAVECVALLAGERDPSHTLNGFRAFASELGLLFQIVDDILDVTGTDAALGKPRGSDARHGKVTYVTRYGLEQARQLAERSRETALAALPFRCGELEQITDFVAYRTS